jgi:hypothetical protein
MGEMSIEYTISTENSKCKQPCTIAKVTLENRMQ